MMHRFSTALLDKIGLRKIKAKTALAITLAIALNALFIYLYFPRLLQKQAVQIIKAKADSVAEMISFSVSPAVFFEDSVTVEETLAAAARNQDIVYIVIQDERGRIIASLNPREANALRYAAIRADLSPQPGENVYRLGHPLSLRRQTIGRMFIGFSMRDLNQKIVQSRKTAALVSLLIFLGGIVFAVSMSALITAPLIQISRAANAIAGGDLNQRAVVRSEDEAGQLARSFNIMVGKLQSATLELESLNHNLEKRVHERTEALESEIAERRKTEMALHETYSQLHTLIQAIPDMIQFKDPHGKIRIFNKAFAKFVGKKHQDIFGKTDAEVFPPEVAEYWKSTDLEVIARRKMSKPDEHAFELNQKTMHFATIKAPLFDESGEILGLLAVSRDITEQKEADGERKRMEVQLLQAQKMEAVGILAGGIAHDFNNLLTAIIGGAEMGLANLREGDPLYYDLFEIQRAGERAADLTRQLLYFSRKQHMQFKEIRLNELIESLFKMFHRLIGEDITIYTEFGLDLWRLKGDTGTLEQVIMNLAVNARDAMPRGGSLILKTENVEFKDEADPLSLEAKPGKYVHLSVADTGTGMDRETLQHIFEPFFTTKAVGRGTGLGLSVVYGIVKQHEGWVNVDSESGAGSTFHIYLPAVFQKGGRLQSPQEGGAVPDVKGRGERILVIEDEMRLSQFIRRALEENGYKVHLANNAHEAQEIFDGEKGRFDLVLSDVVLPGKGGLELMEAFRSRRPDLKVLLSSGYTDHKNQWPMIQEKGYRFLQKPYNLHELLKTIRMIILQE
jgi:PAS domain S-box-containing protein